MASSETLIANSSGHPGRHPAQIRSSPLSVPKQNPPVHGHSPAQVISWSRNRSDRPWTRGEIIHAFPSTAASVLPWSVDARLPSSGERLSESARGGGCGGSRLGSSGPSGKPCQCGPESVNLAICWRRVPRAMNLTLRPQAYSVEVSLDRRSIPDRQPGRRSSNSSFSLKSMPIVPPRARPTHDACRRRSNESPSSGSERDGDDRLHRRLT